MPLKLAKADFNFVTKYDLNDSIELLNVIKF